MKNTFCLSEKAMDEGFWKSVRENRKYARLIDVVLNFYNENRGESFSVIKYSHRKIYFTTGSRAEGENVYFKRRNFMSAAAVLCLIYPDNEDYKTDLQDAVWAVCDEYSWAVPAHTSGKFDDDSTMIDLFVAETGFALAEICAVLGDRLDEAVRVRVKHEIRRRVAEPYGKREFFWDNAEHNWAAVCSGSVGGCLMYTDPELFEQYLPRILHSLERYISGFPEDGTCAEGFSYWLYGFGYYLWFADLLYRYTGGKQDLLQGEKIKNISEFPRRNFILGNTVVSFSDCNRFSKTNLAMQYLLHNRFPEEAHLFPESMMNLYPANLVWVSLFRAFVYFDPDAEAKIPPKKDYFLPRAGQYIINRENYSFAIKAGCNEEPHNHNDVGCIIFSDSDGQAVCDIGAGRYTREYFQYEHRYEIFNNSSLSHSVPIIGGCTQRPGREYCGELSAEDGIIKVSMAGAYGIPELKSLLRTVICVENGVILRDSFDIDGREITERFITTREVELKSGEVRMGKTVLRYPPEACTAEVSTVHPEKHRANSEGVFERENVRCVDLKLNPGVKELEIRLTVLNIN